MLVNAGINFEQLKTQGIPYESFTARFKEMGFAVNSRLTWLAFNSKYDFAYLLAMFGPLPSTA